MYPLHPNPKVAARWWSDWAAAGFDPAILSGMLEAMESDRTEARARAGAFKKTGRLMDTIHVVRPRLGAAVKRGFVSATLAAGSRSSDRRKRVAYAGVLQTGWVYGRPGGRTRRHTIAARRGSYGEGGQFQITGRLRFNVGGHFVTVPLVEHPGNRFPRREYLQVNEQRLGRSIESSLDDSFRRRFA